MVGFPAARMTDPHTCPICMGAPLPILPPCAVTVMIGGLPAARQTDLCTCIPPPVPDMIAFGSPTVKIMGLPAARMLDPTAKGGLILFGHIFTLIGIVGVPSVVLPSGLVVSQIQNPAGSVSLKVGENMVVQGTPEFQAQVAKDLDKLYATPTGKSLIDSINTPGKKPVKIIETADGNKVNGTTRQGWKQSDGTPGSGSGSTLNYNPNRTQVGDGSEPWMTRPPAVGLGHELVHCEQAQNGTWSDDKTNGTENDELQAAGVPPFENGAHTENKIRKDLGEPPRTRY
ncbi:MAG: M91 family zinc metallopeptidase [Paracoccaceae bacterium]